MKSKHVTYGGYHCSLHRRWQYLSLDNNYSKQLYLKHCARLGKYCPMRYMSEFFKAFRQTEQRSSGCSKIIIYAYLHSDGSTVDIYHVVKRVQ